MQPLENKQITLRKTGLDLDRDQPAVWQRCLAGVYRAGIGSRLMAYRWGLLRPRKLPVRVICVGNLTVGGTGKTPTVMTVVKSLQARGIRPGVLSRGYGGKNRDKVSVVSDGERVLLGPDQAGDEPCLLAEALPGVPVLVGSSRYDTGSCAIERFGVQTLVMDDGYQHLKLDRQVNLLLLDGKKPWGNGCLLPAGRLREPMGQAARATAFILTQAESASGETLDQLKRLYPGRPIFLAGRRPSRLKEWGAGDSHSPDHLRDREVAAFCGLANPGSFHDTLTTLGARVRVFMRWPDHYRPREEDFRLIRQKARETGIRDWVTTAKDAVKLAGSSLVPGEIRIWVLEIEMEILNDLETFAEIVAGDGGEVDR